MNLHISKSKNAESFYICKSYVKVNGTTSSMIVRKLGTLEQLLLEHGPTCLLYTSPSPRDRG